MASWSSIVVSAEAKDKMKKVEQEEERKKRKERERMEREKEREEKNAERKREIELENSSRQRQKIFDKAIEFRGRFKYVNFENYLSNIPLDDPIRKIAKDLSVSEECSAVLLYNMSRSRGTLEYLRELVEIDRLTQILNVQFDWSIPIKGESFDEELKELRKKYYELECFHRSSICL